VIVATGSIGKKIRGASLAAIFLATDIRACGARER
jgi:hypothetical protein